MPGYGKTTGRDRIVNRLQQQPRKAKIQHFFYLHYSMSPDGFCAEKVQAASPADAATLILPDRRIQGCPLPGTPPRGPQEGPGPPGGASR